MARKKSKKIITNTLFFLFYFILTCLIHAFLTYVSDLLPITFEGVIVNFSLLIFPILNYLILINLRKIFNKIGFKQTKMIILNTAFIFAELYILMGIMLFINAWNSVDSIEIL